MLQRWDVNRHTVRYTDTDPWARSVKIGVWLRALGNGDQRLPMSRKAREGLYVLRLQYTVDRGETYTHFSVSSTAIY